MFKFTKTHQFYHVLMIKKVLNYKLKHQIANIYSMVKELLYVVGDGLTI